MGCSLLPPHSPPNLGRGEGAPGQLLQFGLGIVQAVPLHVLVRRVGQEFMEGQDVPGDLQVVGEGGGREVGGQGQRGQGASERS